MNDESEMWKQHRQAQRERREKRLPVRTEDILALRNEGYKIEQKTEYHIRINDVLDVWPTHNRWHDIPRDMRGGAKDLVAFIKRRLQPYYKSKPQGDCAHG